MSRQQTLTGKIVHTKEDKKVVDQMMDRLNYVFNAPIIAHPMWKSIITKEQRNRATTYRLAQSIKGDYSEGATDYEALLYLSTISYLAPLTRTGYRVYAYLFRRQFPEQAKEILGQDGRDLDEYMEASMLRRLKIKIYKSQRKYLKNKKKGKVKLKNATVKLQRKNKSRQLSLTNT